MSISRLAGLRRPAVTMLATLAATAAVLAPAGAANAETGIDVASWQHGGPLNWSAVKNDGVSFAFVKATEGSSYTNPYFRSDWDGARRVGIRRGAYHFARPSVGSAKKQARYFVSRAGRHQGRGDLPPVLDLESTGDLTTPQLRAWTANWLAAVESLTGRTPIIYTSPSFWENYLGNTRAFSRYPLWIAHYGVSQPRVPGGWATWSFWQQTDQGRVRGIQGDVDINRFNGNRRQFRALSNLPVPRAGAPRRKAGSVTTLRSGVGRIHAGQRVRLSGWVTTAAGKPLAWKPVTVRARAKDGRGWVDVARARTGPRGRYEVAVRPRQGTVRYKSVFAGSAAHTSSASSAHAVRVLPKVTTTVTLDAEQPLTLSGAEVTFSGVLTTDEGDALVRHEVELHQRLDGESRWTLVGTARSARRTGRWEVDATASGSATYRAVFPGTVSHARAASGDARVSVLL